MLMITAKSVQEDKFENKIVLTPKLNQIVLLDGFILPYKYCKSVQIFQLSCLTGYFGQNCPVIRMSSWTDLAVDPANIGCN